MNIQRKNSAHHFRMQSEREQTLVYVILGCKNGVLEYQGKSVTIQTKIMMQKC